MPRVKIAVIQRKMAVDPINDTDKTEQLTIRHPVMTSCREVRLLSKRLVRGY